MIHLIKVIRTKETDEYEGLLTFECGRNVYEAFYWGDKFKTGEKLEASISALEYPLTWEVIFGENKSDEIRMEKANSGEASYYCYGKIESLHPVMADFGDLKVELGEWTNDEKVIGEFIYWKIARLNIKRV